MEKKTDQQVNGYIIGELSFILLPFLVMTIIYAHEDKLKEILQEPEWSLAAAVMFGQSIIKMIHITVNAGKKNYTLKKYNIGALIAILILIGLVPSLIVLSLIYTSEQIHLWLFVLQMALFILGIYTFCFISKIQVEEEE